MSVYKYEDMKRFNQTLLIFGVILIAFNLRPSITAVGPLIGMISSDLQLPGWSLGLITSLPLIGFAIMSPITPLLSRRYSNEVVVIGGMVTLAIGMVLRSIPMIFFLFAGTILIGVGIAVANVLLPGIIKERFPDNVGMMTGVYSTAMGLMAALASGLSIPLAGLFNNSWELSLAVWIIPAVLGIAVWTYFVRHRTSADEVEVQYIAADQVKMWRSRLAWEVSIFLGLQALFYYVLIAWLPSILQENGLSNEFAGWMLSYSQFIGLPFGLFLPILAGKLKSQTRITVGISLLAIAGTCGLFFSQSSIIMFTSVTLVGLTSGALFPLSLAFLGMRAGNAQQAAELSGMAQALGYFLAAIGPIAAGYLRDLGGSWHVPLIVLIVCLIFMTIAGYGAGRNRTISDEYQAMAGNRN
ncbi:CynX/NimT family MFS transporter [Virgibacillus kimchii]